MIITAVILAGGKATRFGGVDKRAIVIDGATIFERQCTVLRSRVSEILVSAPHPTPGFRTVADIVPEAGPLAGIAAALAAAATPWLLVVAGDMPSIDGALIDLVLARVVAATPDVDAIGIRIGELPEPLLCVLRVATARPIAEARLAARVFKASRLLTDGDLVVSWIGEAELRAIDPELRTLRNINAPVDLH